MTAQKVISVPTDKSMPAVMMTKVQATASTPLTAVACRMLTMLSACRKLGDASVKKMSRASRLAKASRVWRVDGDSSLAFSEAITSGRLTGSSGGDSGREGLSIGVPRLGSSVQHHGLALGGEVHDLFLRRIARGNLAGDPALTHDQDAVADAHDFGQL